MNIQKEIEGLKIRDAIRPNSSTVLSGTLLSFEIGGVADLSVWAILAPFAVYLLMLFVNTVIVIIRLIWANMGKDE